MESVLRRPNRQVRPSPCGGIQRGDGRQWRPSIADRGGNRDRVAPLCKNNAGKSPTLPRIDFLGRERVEGGKARQNLGLTNGFYGDIVNANQKDVKPVTGMSTVSELPF